MRIDRLSPEVPCCESLEPRALLSFAIADYFPTTLGASWTTAGLFDGASGAETTTASASVTESGRLATRFDTIGNPSSPFEIDSDFLSLDSSGLRLLRQDTSSPETNSTVSYTGGLLFAPAVVDIGQSFSHFTPVTGVVDGHAFTGTMNGTVSIAALENVSAPAGTFLAVKLVRSDTFTFIFSGLTVNGTVQDARWFVRTLGAVRIEWTSDSTSSNGDHTVSTQASSLTESSLLTGRVGLGLMGKQTPIAKGDSTPTTVDGTNYGGIDVSATTKTRVFVITNASAGTLAIGAVTISGAHAGDFSLVHAPLSSIAPGQTTYLSVRFDPSAEGFRYATISFASSDPTADPFAFSIRGTGLLLGKLQVRRSDKSILLQAGSSADLSRRRDVVRANERARLGVHRSHVRADQHRARHADVHGRSPHRVRITGPAAGDFTLLGDIAGTLAPGASLVFTVRFDPSALDRRDAVIDILSTDHAVPDWAFAISGRGK